jgi:hypothetical protein
MRFGAAAAPFAFVPIVRLYTAAVAKHPIIFFVFSLLAGFLYICFAILVDTRPSS